MDRSEAEIAVDQNPWRTQSAVGFVAVCLSTLFLSLIAIAASVNRADLNSGQGQSIQAAGRASQELILPDGQTLEITALAQCDGIQLGKDLFVVLDPLECDPDALGTVVLLPESGSTTIDQIQGPIVLVPDDEGAIGSLRSDEEGLTLVAPGGAASKLVVTMQNPTGATIEFDRPDDSKGAAELTPIDGRIFSQGDPGLFDFSSFPEGDQRQQPAEQDDKSAPWISLPNLSRLAPALSFVALLMIAGLALYFYRTRLRRDWFRRSSSSPIAVEPDADGDGLTLVEQIDLIDQLLWEIDQEPDPRKAIQRVYGAVESGLGHAEMVRKPSETPAVYLSRVLGRFDQARPTLTELTALFEVARFSVTPITEEMRQQSVAALQQLRSEYARLSALQETTLEGSASSDADQSALGPGGKR